MKHYELLCVLPGTLAEADLAPATAAISTVLSESGITDVKIEDKGKSRLAYPMKHIRYGYFYHFTFQAEPQQITEIQEKLRLNRQLLRALVTVFDPERRVQMEEAIAKSQAQQEKQKREIPAKATPEKKEAPAAAPETPAAEAKEETADAEAKTTEQPAEATIEQLDKKLDEILDKTLETV